MGRGGVGASSRWWLVHYLWITLIWIILIFRWSEAGNCSRRVVFNNTWGLITDGAGSYTSHSHCEWLIEATKPGKVINLIFESMETECSYDHLFVYDGWSYDSKMLGAFSGDRKPTKLMATSGFMLLYFYSDWNYEKKGFVAEYSVTDCAYNCSGNNGHCNALSNTCVCNTGYTGTACETEICPGNCNRHGHCNTTSQKCDCIHGYTGYGCTVPMTYFQGSTENHDEGIWHEIAPGDYGFTARTGHAGVFVNNNLYIFGGNTLNRLLDELIKYDFNKSKWVTLEKSLPWPDARYSHAMSVYKNVLYIFGGILQDGSHTNDLWKYDIAASKWTDTNIPESIRPTAVAGHTLTLVKNQYIYLFGGRTTEGSFLSDMYKIDLLNASLVWEKVIPHGGKTEHRRLVGHTTVYHKESQSLLVFGGFTPDSARFPQRTNNLHTFHVTNNYWVEIVYDPQLVDFDKSESHEVPSVRAFHSAAIMGNYMVVYGGNAHIHTELETCYDGEIYFYHLGCHTWVRRQDLEKAFVTTTQSNVKHYGRFSNVAVVAFGDTLVLSGGYRGNVLGDLIAYKVPISVARNKHDVRFDNTTTHCQLHTNYDHCKYDSECVWCMGMPNTGEPGCMARSQQKLCSGDVRQGYCQNICSTLHDCGSCTVQGGGVGTVNNPPGWWYNPQCEWCVKDATCHTVGIRWNGPTDTCFMANGTESGLVGWWNGKSKVLKSLPQCRFQDYPAGLHVLAFDYPPDWKHPDEVTIERKSGTQFTFVSLLKNKDFEYEGKDYTIKMRGFIHPLGVKPVSTESHLTLILVATQAITKLYMSTNESESGKELVAEVASLSYDYAQTNRSGNRPIVVNESRGHKYFTEVVASHTIDKNPKKSNVQIERTESQGKPFRKMMDYEFLEPFNGGDCSMYDTCLACMTDTSCGWCSLNNECLLRSDVEATCMSGSAVAELVIIPQHCVVCADKIGCSQCLGDSMCEWSINEARCTRRGRFNDSVKALTNCPVKCHLRSSCSDCIGGKDECAWCESTKKCFPFMEYVVRYAFGGCGDWVDKSGKGICHDCSKHTNATLCLGDFRCGWCGNTNNPTIGRCVDGDFSGPANQIDCTKAIYDSYNISELSGWHYSRVPDIEECRLGLHECHGNATCINTYSSYECQCNKGFTGNGKQTCDRTCFYDCVYGTCSGAPNYECLCETGWTGAECNKNCLCNNHSSCSQGIGKCDACQDLTTGAFCDECIHGAYGNATTAVGCKKCDCNGHEDPSKHSCDKITGKCYCQHNTQGDHCEKCIDGYYGDPRGGKSCYLKCEGRTIISNASTGALGSREGSGVGDSGIVYCLWIITPFSYLNGVNKGSSVPTISFTVEPDLKLACTQDHLYIYDGIPTILKGSSPGVNDHSILLGSFCGDGISKAVSVVAQSGVMAVLFQGNTSTGTTVGFNGTYNIHRCPSDCHGNRICGVDNLGCKCNTDYGGPDCDIKLCPTPKCGSGSGGNCDSLTLKQCVCFPGYVGDNCEVKVQPSIIAVQLLQDPYRTKGIVVYESDMPRMGQTVVACGSDNLYMFGGYSLSRGPLNDLWSFDVSNNQWQKLTFTGDIPSPRYHHAAVCEPTDRIVYMYGGLVGSLGARSDLWKFDTKTTTWTKIENNSSITLPDLAGHTMTLVDKSIYIIGGFSKTKYFSNQTYVFDVTSMKWSVLHVTGYPPVGVYGHTAVVHTNSENTKIIYVYGGYEFEFEKVIPSNKLYSLNLGDRRWSTLPPEDGNKPEPRFFHTAVSLPEYMVIYGGKVTDDKVSSELMIYRYRCNRWMAAAHIQGSELPAVMSTTAVVVNGDIYLIGGYNTQMQGAVYKVIMPDDVCNIYTQLTRCLSETGCSACYIHLTNKTYCYSSDAGYPKQCASAMGTLVGNSSDPPVTNHTGTKCDLQLLTSRDCNEHLSCSECLADWPIQSYRSHPCKWCAKCDNGKCIDVKKTCATEHQCSAIQEELTQSDKCPNLKCHSADCNTCLDMGGCVWTNRLKRDGEVPHMKSKDTPFNYNCVRKAAAVEANIQMSTICPTPCYYHTNCQECLTHTGAEGGTDECIWSPLMQQCLPLHYLELFCSAGQCGHLLQGSDNLCPRPCSHYTQCTDCLTQSQCGWCSLVGLNGEGLCMEGGLQQPHSGVCNGSTITTPTTLTAEFKKQIDSLNGPFTSAIFSWSYMKCPLENECLNNHSKCNTFEDCIDLEKGYKCQCKTGYEEKKYASFSQCEPLCSKGCVHGSCDQPDMCTCHFSYVGENCSTECMCNRHSDCTAIDRRDCTKCLNNTVGKQCENCDVLYMGTPTNGSMCHPCKDFCNNHSDVCLSKKDYEKYKNKGKPVDKVRVKSWASVGPRNTDDAMCVNCQHHASGPNCSQCLPGYFRPTDEPPTNPCRECECHGHSDRCDSTSGVCYACKNNTKSQTSCGTSGTKKCWEVQCSECMEGYLGTPTDGHQCYLEMSIDSGYCYDSTTEDKCCYDPYTQTECQKHPTVLGKGKAMFYAIQPKYLNVDIRIVLDVTVGALDVYLSPFEDTWILNNDAETWEHQITIDPKYTKHIKSYNTEDTDPDMPQRTKRASFHDPFIYSSSIGGHNGHSMWTLPDPLPLRHSLHKSRRDTTILGTGNSTKSPPSSDLYDNKTIKLVDTSAEGMFSFKAIKYNETFLIVRNVQNRLVISLPFIIHQLKVNRFYMILHGRGNAESNETFGSVFFRQDQPHIDLFVFFAVFFASFFMKLAVIVLIWKGKQSCDARRSRQQRQKEMRHMASRPFSKCSVLFDPVYNWENETCEEYNSTTGENTPLMLSETSNMSSQSLGCNRYSIGGNAATNFPSHRESSKHGSFLRSKSAGASANQNQRSSHVTSHDLNNQQPAHPLSLPSLLGNKHRVGIVSDCNVTGATTLGGGSLRRRRRHASTSNVYPLALEPLDDAVAAVGTVIFQLPGGLYAPVSLSFGSAFVTFRMTYPSLQRQHSSSNTRSTALPRQGSTSV